MKVGRSTQENDNPTKALSPAMKRDCLQVRTGRVLQESHGIEAEFLKVAEFVRIRTGWNFAGYLSSFPVFWLILRQFVDLKRTHRRRMA